MKVIHTPIEKIQEYYSSPAISQSLLKATLKTSLHFFNIYNSVRVSDKYYDEPEDQFIIGSGVDCYVTEGIETFEQRYFVPDMEKKPSDEVISIVKKVFDSISSDYEDANTIPDLSTFRELILESVNFHNWSATYKDDAKYNAIVTKGSEYWKALIQGRGRVIITATDYLRIKNVGDSVLNSKFFKRIMEYPSSIIVYQVPLYFEMDGMACKALVDMIVFCNGKVYLVDLKTMSGNVADFSKSMKRFRYDIQAAWYLFAFSKDRSWVNNYPDLTSEEKRYLIRTPDKVYPFRFLVESSTNPVSPIEYFCTKEFINHGAYGEPKMYYDVVSKDFDRVSLRVTDSVPGYISLFRRAAFYIMQIQQNVSPLPEFRTTPDQRAVLDWEEVRELQEYENDLTLNLNI